MVSCNAVSQFTTMVIDSRAFQGGAWCANGYDNLLFGPEYLWQGIWGLQIPYLVSPLSISCYVVKWLDIWGISSPGQVFDFSDEVLSNGPADQHCWDTRYGAVEWDEYAKGANPYVNIRCGAFAYNILRQHWQMADHLVIT